MEWTGQQIYHVKQIGGFGDDKSRSATHVMWVSHSYHNFASMSHPYQNFAADNILDFIYANEKARTRPMRGLASAANRSSGTLNLVPTTN